MARVAAQFLARLKKTAAAKFDPSSIVAIHLGGSILESHDVTSTGNIMIRFWSNVEPLDSDGTFKTPWWSHSLPQAVDRVGRVSDRSPEVGSSPCLHLASLPLDVSQYPSCFFNPARPQETGYSVISRSDPGRCQVCPFEIQCLDAGNGLVDVAKPVFLTHD